MAEWSEALITKLEVAGSNPTWVFFIFFQFFQTLRAYFRFQRTRANMGPFPLKTRGSGPPLHAVKVRGMSRHLYET